MHAEIRIQTEAFDAAAEQQVLMHRTANSGAAVSFTGFVRGRDGAVPLAALELEHYPVVTESEIARIIDTAARRWPLEACAVVHRVGRLKTGEAIVWVCAASAHRKAAFAAAEFVMDYLKTEAPFWKKEIFSDGTEHWVEAKQSDRAALDKWGVS